MASLQNIVLLGAVGGLVYYFIPAAQQEINDLGKVALKVIQGKGIDVNLTNRPAAYQNRPTKQPQELRDINYTQNAKAVSIEDKKKESAMVAEMRMKQAAVTIKQKQAYILPKGTASYKPVIAASLSGDIAIY